MAVTIHTDQSGSSRYRAYAKLSGIDKNRYFPLTDQGKADAEVVQVKLDLMVRMAVNLRSRRIFDPYSGKIIGISVSITRRESKKDEIYFKLNKILDGKRIIVSSTIHQKNFNAAFKTVYTALFEFLELNKSDITSLQTELTIAKRYYLQAYSKLI